MRFQTPLVPGTLLRRYKRFFADVRLDDGQEVTAHCPNTGPMTSISDPGSRVWLEPNDDPKKKLKYGWRLLENGGGHYTGVDTSLPNKIVKEALQGPGIPGLERYDAILPEQKYGANSRIDFLLRAEGRRDAYVEVKSVTLNRAAGLAEFPDTVTTRGQKHLQDLGDMADAGHRAVMLYLVQRTDCTRVSLAEDYDPAYVAAYHAAKAKGLEVIALDCRIAPEGITTGRVLEFVL
ncbi:MAG: DNA/RNA nuclease SfsA [Pseudomonadota bacterium]